MRSAVRAATSSIVNDGFTSDEIVETTSLSQITWMKLLASSRCAGLRLRPGFSGVAPDPESTAMPCLNTISPPGYPEFKLASRRDEKDGKDAHSVKL